ncbi:MAG TPA: carboxypeptidase-like regulatory domain-containing protein, partial [Candidatus Dormibacteraeota bacterium]|nr:carboxypeptidase-like regulatory domain-containing protein [Candidatus Dormibacteraeota bacterium]
MQWSSLKLSLLISSVAFLLALTCAQAQVGTASVFGDVTDPKGMPVADARVTLTYIATGVTRTAETDSGGRYEFLALQPGSYKIQVEAKGFKAAVQENLELLVNTATRANFALTIGSMSEIVQVTEAAAPLNTSDASLGNVLDNTQINNIPLEARSVVALLSLQPGATFLPVRPGTDEMRSGSISGSRSDQSNVTLDGADVNDPQSQTGAYEAALRITAESLQEFRVTTSTYDATQGRSSAGQVAMITKSGTNAFHGSGYWYHRNTATSTNEYFNKLSQLSNGKPNKPPVLQKHVFGGTIGGPIWKDRAFFFFNYEGLHQFSQNAAFRNIPSATFRDGIIIYKCRTASQCAASSVAGVSGTSYPIAGGFHGLSPAEFAAIDPKGIGPDLAALKYWSQYPQPNDPGRDGGRNIVGFRFAAPLKDHFNTSIARLDYKLDSRGNHTLFWRGEIQQDTVNGEPQFPGRPPNNKDLIRPKGSIVGYSAVLSPRVVNNLRWGWTRFSLLSAGLQTSDVSTFRFLDTFEGPLGGSTGATSARQFLTNNLVDDISYTRGAHTFQMGTNVRFSRLPRFNNQFNLHSAIANGSWLPGVGRKFMPGRATCTTPGCSQVPAVASSDAAVWADSSIDLWGLLTQGNARYNYNKDGSLVAHGIPIHRRYASNEYELYFQDVWRARSNLTFTFGVRYALYSPPWETNGLQVAPTPSLGTYYDERLRGMQAGIPSNQLPRISFDLAGAANGRKGYYDWQWNNYAPRMSFAWNPKFSNGFLGHLSGNGRLVIRGGYGLVYDRVGQALATTFDSGAAFGLSTNLLTPYASLTEATAPRWTAVNATPPVGSPSGSPLLLSAPPGGFPA